MLLPIHIAAGGLAILLGGAALIVKKGGTPHRRIGILFVYAMLVMGGTGAVLGIRTATPGNVFAGIMVAYFVVTALTTVRPESVWTRRVNVAAIGVAVTLASLDILAGIEAFNSPGGTREGVPFAMLFFLASIMLLAAWGDVRVLRSGTLRGRSRLARHLWRMCFALFIAAGSFFSIRSRVATILPDPFTTLPLRMLPILLPFAAMLFWALRLRGRRAPRVILRHDSIPPA